MNLYSRIKNKLFGSEDARIEEIETDLAKARLIPISTSIVGVGSAGDDLDGTTTAFFAVPSGKSLTIDSIKLISQGTAEGIDNDNTAVIAIKYGTTTVATKTYNTGSAFPSAKAITALTIDNAVVPASSVLFVTVTNGSTAKTPAFRIQIIGAIA